jgi:hypothetical protein
MNPYLENITDAQKTKVTEATGKVEVKCKAGTKAAPKPAPATAAAAPPRSTGPKIPARLAARFGAKPNEVSAPSEEKLLNLLRLYLHDRHRWLRCRNPSPHMSQTKRSETRSQHQHRSRRLGLLRVSWLVQHHRYVSSRSRLCNYQTDFVVPFRRQPKSPVQLQPNR